jgi:DNA-binding MarR family transcriptional regulator
MNKAVDIIARECIAVRVRMLNRVITGIYDDALRPLGLKASQMNILVVASKLVVARPAQVCELLQLDTSTLSRNVDRMLASGWLETVADEDGRGRPFRITPKGAALLEKAVPAWRQAQKKATTMLGEQGVAAMNHAVKKLAPTMG